MSGRMGAPHALAARLAGALLWLTAGPAAAGAADGHAWRREDAGGGCQLETAPVAGRDYIAARAACVVPASIEVVGAVLQDIERYPEWMEDCAQTKLLKVIDRERDRYVFWFRQHVTLFADRDMVLESEGVVLEDRRIVVRASSTSSVPYDSGGRYVRMPAFESEWVLEKLDDARTRVSFMIAPDLAAGLPLGFANAKIKETPLRSLQGLARMARLPRYAARGPARDAATSGASPGAAPSRR